MSESKKVLIILTGSIACYKVCHVISRLVQAGCDVQVVASKNALQFVGPATLEGLTGKSVISDLYATGSVMEHIHLMRWADLILVAPATANFMNKAASGVGDDLVQTLFLAHDFTRPFLIAPAMNTSMYIHPATQKSVKILTDMGVEILETASGVLACGEEGWGRLLDPDLILKAVLDKLNTYSEPKTIFKKAESPTPIKVLITAGGTQEPLDTVRTLSNLSTGRTGVSLAEFLSSLGIQVTLVKAEASVKTALENVHTFTSFKSLQNTVQKVLAQSHFDFVVHAAAVSDYSIDSIEVDGKKFQPLDQNKISSTADHMSLHLKRNPKIVDSLQAYSANKDLKVVAFKLTSKATLEQQQVAVKKLFVDSKASWVVHNDLSEIDTQKKQHRFTVYDSKMNPQACENLSDLCAYLSRVMMESQI